MYLSSQLSVYLSVYLFYVIHPCLMYLSTLLDQSFPVCIDITTDHLCKVRLTPKCVSDMLFIRSVFLSFYLVCCCCCCSLLFFCSVTLPLTILGGIWGKRRATKAIEGGRAFPCKVRKRQQKQRKSRRRTQNERDSPIQPSLVYRCFTLSARLIDA